MTRQGWLKVGLIGLVVIAIGVVVVRRGGDGGPAELGRRPGEPAEVPLSRARAGEDPDTLLVRFRPGTAPPAAEAALAAAGARQAEEIPAIGFAVVTFAGRPKAEVARLLEAAGVVEVVEPNRRRSVTVAPNDPLYDRQLTDLRVLRLPEAWDRARGSDQIVLAVVDTGVDLGHPDLSARLVPGQDIVNGDDRPDDDHGHGTMVAGLAAAQTDNGEGVAGAAWQGRIQPVKVLAGDGSGYDSDVAKGIVWAADNGAHVINLSLAGPGRSSALQAAVNHALAKGALVVAAAGNESTSQPQYPAACEGVLAVSATDSIERPASFTNYGDWVDVAAPGVSVVTTGAGAEYVAGSGTSFSSPLVAGVAVLLRSADPGAGPTRIAALLRETARDLGDPGFDPYYGSGMVDAAAALESAGQAPPGNAAPPPGEDPSGSGEGGSGYWLLLRDGRMLGFGRARAVGTSPPALRGARAADAEATPSGNGYWVLDNRGNVHASGDARHLGDLAGLRGGEEAVALSATPSGDGYWVFTSRGRAAAFGKAPFFGDMSGTRLNAPVGDSATTSSGRGYYMVAADGGIFSFGDAAFAGSMGGRPLNAPVESLVPDGDGSGYYLVASDGGVFAFDAPFRGSMGGTRLNRPITGMVRFGDGYLMVGEDGGIFNFSNQPFQGSAGGRPPSSPVVAVAAVSG